MGRPPRAESAADDCSYHDVTEVSGVGTVMRAKKKKNRVYACKTKWKKA